MNLSDEEQRKKTQLLLLDGWFPTLSIDDVEEIIDNTNTQIDNPSKMHYLTAFKFFFENDAFIDWSEHSMQS